MDEEETGKGRNAVADSLPLTQAPLYDTEAPPHGIIINDQFNPNIIATRMIFTARTQKNYVTTRQKFPN